MSSFVNGNLPCRSQQLWQSGHRHFHKMYRLSLDKVGMWKVMPPTLTDVSDTPSLYFPVWKSYNFGSIFHFLARRSSASLTGLLSWSTMLEGYNTGGLNVLSNCSSIR